MTMPMPTTNISVVLSLLTPMSPEDLNQAVQIIFTKAIARATAAPYPNRSEALHVLIANITVHWSVDEARRSSGNISKVDVSITSDQAAFQVPGIDAMNEQFCAAGLPAAALYDPSVNAPLAFPTCPSSTTPASSVKTSLTSAVGVIVAANVAVAVGSTVAAAAASVGASGAAGVSGSVAYSGISSGGSSATSFVEDTSSVSGTNNLVSQVQYLNMVGQIGGGKSSSLRSYSEGYNWANLDLGLNVVVSCA